MSDEKYSLIKQPVSSTEWLSGTSKSMGFRSQKLQALDGLILDALYVNWHKDRQKVIKALENWRVGEPAEYKRRSISGVVAQLEHFLDVHKEGETDIDRLVNEVKMIDGRQKILLVVASLKAEPKYAAAAVAAAFGVGALGPAAANVKPSSPVVIPVSAGKLAAKTGAKKLDAPSAAAGDSNSTFLKDLEKFLIDALYRVVQKWRDGTVGFVSKTLDYSKEISTIVIAVIKEVGTKVLPIIGPAIDLGVNCKKSFEIIVQIATTSYHKSKLDIKHGTPAFLIKGMQEAMQGEMLKRLASTVKSASFLTAQVFTLGAAALVTAVVELGIVAISMLYNLWCAASINEASVEAVEKRLLGPSFINGDKFNPWFKKVMINNPPIAAALLNSKFCPTDMFFFNMKMDKEGIFVDDSWTQHVDFLTALRLKGKTYLNDLGLTITATDEYVSEGLKGAVYS